MDRARGRLAVISAHLVTADVVDISTLLEASPVISNAMARQVVKLGGTLRVIDERNGKEYRVVVRDDGTVMASDFKQIRYGNGKWLKLYDPGYINTAPTRSAICYIDGEEGILRYRGYPIQDLAYGSTFTEVAYLLIFGRLPSYRELENWEFSISQNSAIPKGVLNIIEAAPKDAHPMCVLLSAIGELSVHFPDANPTIGGQGLYKAKEVRRKQIARILGMMPTIAATIRSVLKGESYALPSKNFSYSRNFLYMVDSRGDMRYKPSPKFVEILDILFILHAEHEMNCSTAAARHLASSGANIFAVLAGAVGALYGPLDGGANEAAYKMLIEIKNSQKNIPEFIEGVKKGKFKLSGFGHRVYKSKDPRAEIVLQLIKEAYAGSLPDELLGLALEVEEAARKDEYFIKRNLYPNVHFYSAVLYSALGFEERFFTLFFAVPRMAGLLAHWVESLDDPDAKIIRPQQVYSGELFRRYVPVEEHRRITEAGKFVPSQTSVAARSELQRKLHAESKSWSS